MASVSASCRWLALIFLVLVTWSAACIDCASFGTTSSDVHAPASDLGAFQTLEKTWSVSGPITGLHNLIVQAPCTVFVDYDASLDASDLVAKVVLTGDSEVLLNAFQVVSLDELSTSDGLTLRFQPGNDVFQGHVLAHILVSNKHMLQSIKSFSSADVVVSDSVLASSDTVGLSALGRGNVTVLSTEKFVLDTLSIVAAGGGSVVLQAPSIHVDSVIIIDSVGSGVVAVIADSEIKAHAVVAKSVGSGDIAIQASSISAASINTLTSGSGNVTISGSGSCVSQSVKLIGSGSFSSGSIVAQAADISVYGSGNALVQATGKLTAMITGSGELYYVNDAPKELVVRGWPWSLRGSSRKKVKQAQLNELPTFHPRVQSHKHLPTLVTSSSAIRLETQSLEASGFSTVLSALSGIDYLEVLLCILVGVGAMLKFRKRRLRDRLLRRNQHTPLVVATAAIQGVVALLSTNSNRR